ncbi:PTS sugar transporter subunit IIA [Microbacterium sp. Leaf151]|uniref:PTS sugar transporter subunit IIA n=1 Tax=Microbacterium sp. Leaf151 TaxID=1736276 RepID=UPI0006FE176A|nr:PTS glucose transporter subunit IIA [Microbacterium sp. Leaf151]KQR23342.1 PTS glucose transporter subunit IIA [Microbacterium sp. Leaf151]
MPDILSPLVGTVLPLSAVPDPLFAQGAMGPGVAIDPPADVVDAVAPIDGTLLQVFPHAFVVVADDGLAVLVHLGLDTVQLQGQGFTAFAAKGDRVSAGTPVIAYDVPAIRAAGLSSVVSVVVLERSADEVTVVGAEGADVLPGARLLSV